jgi:hypothetical protein
MNLEVFCGGYIDLAVGGMTNQPTRKWPVFAGERRIPSGNKSFRRKTLVGCLADLKSGGGITTAEGLCGLGKQAVHLHELYFGICL